MAQFPAADAASLLARFPEVIAKTWANGVPYLAVLPADLPGVAGFARDELACDQLMTLSGVDLSQFPEAGNVIGVRYFLASTSRRVRLTLAVQVDRDHAVIPSVTGVYPGAGFPEREVFDLLGVHFTGHADLRRLLMPPDWVGHPLRRDYQTPEQYGGVSHQRDGQRFVYDAKKAAAK